MKTLSLAALLLLGCQAQDVEDGHCPFQPGEIKGAVNDSLDVSKIQGQWINTLDEKQLKDQFVCMGSKFQERTKKHLSFLQANSIYEQTRQSLREVGEKQADQKYFVNTGRSGVFTHPTDKSVGFMKSTFTDVKKALKEEDDPTKFNEHKFDA